MKSEHSLPDELVIENNLLLKKTTVDSAIENYDIVMSNLEHLNRFWWANSEYTIEKFVSWITIEVDPNPNAYEYDYRLEGVLIGQFAVRIDSDGKPSFGYWLGKEYESRGYVSKAIEVVSQMLGKLGYSCVEVIYRDNNQRSRAVALRNGFIEVGSTPNPYDTSDLSWIRARKTLSVKAKKLIFAIILS